MAARKPADRRQGRGTSDTVVELVAHPGSLPEPVDDWSEETKAEWVEFWSSETAELVKPSHRASVARLFEWRDRQHQAWDRAKRFRAEADKEPFIEGSTGQPKPNPFYERAEKADAEALQIEARIVALEDRFGLSAAAEIRMGVSFQRKQGLEAMNQRMWEAMGIDGSDSRPSAPADPRSLPGDPAVGAG